VTTLQLTGFASNSSHRGEHHNLLKFVGCILYAAELLNRHKWLILYTSITRHLFIPQFSASICSFADIHALLYCITSLTFSLETLEFIHLKEHRYTAADIFHTHGITECYSQLLLQSRSSYIFSDSSDMLMICDVF